MKRLKNINNLRIAVPNKGRLMAASIEILKNMGLEFEVQDRKLFSPVENYQLDILFLRAQDISRYVESGIVDLGITGIDLVEENNAKVNTLLELGFGKCYLALAVPTNSQIKNVNDLKGKKIATSFPFSTTKYLKKNKIQAEVIEIKGAAEVTPWLGVADAIVDIVSTGESLSAHNLKPIEILFDSQAVLIGNSNLSDAKEKEIERIVSIAQGVINGRCKKYLMMNAPENKLEDIKKIIPGLKSPTVLKLAQPGMIAIHSVVDEKIIWDIIPKLKAIGASGILVSSIEKLVY